MLVLIRGLPGSGKSTMARVKYPNHIHLEADMYFEDAQGNYNYDRSKLKQAHEWCYVTARNLLQLGKPVVVANTFVRKWELQPYLNLPVDVQIVTARGNFKSIHNVPEKALERMRANWEAVSGECH